MSKTLVVVTPKRNGTVEETLPPRPPSGSQSSDIDPFYDRYTPHPGHGLTPQRLLEIYREAEFGWPINQCDTFEDVIERDAHLRSLNETRIDGVAGKEWILQSGGDAEIDHKAAMLLEEALRDCPTFEDAIDHALTAPGVGYSGSEQLWDIAANGAIAPCHFIQVPHRRFVFDPFDRPRLTVQGDLFMGIPLESGRWFWNRRRHRLHVMAGYMRTACWWSIFKTLSVRDWVDLCERFGIPMPYATYDDELPEKEREAIRKAVFLLASGKQGAAVFNDRGKLDFVKNQISDASVHPGLATFCNAEMSKLITGATLTSGEGTSTGSYALGKVHENVSFNIILNDAKRLGTAFARQIGKPFCEWNHLTGAKPPRLKVHVVREIDPQVRVDVMSRTANELGLELDEDQVRQEMQLKKPAAGALKGTKSGPGIEQKTPPTGAVG